MNRIFKTQVVLASLEHTSFSIDLHSCTLFNARTNALILRKSGEFMPYPYKPSYSWQFDCDTSVAWSQLTIYSGAFGETPYSAGVNFR